MFEQFLRSLSKIQVVNRCYNSRVTSNHVRTFSSFMASCFFDNSSPFLHPYFPFSFLKYIYIYIIDPYILRVMVSYTIWKPNLGDYNESSARCRNNVVTFQTFQIGPLFTINTGLKRSLVRPDILWRLRPGPRWRSSDSIFYLPTPYPKSQGGPMSFKRICVGNRFKVTKKQKHTTACLRPWSPSTHGSGIVGSPLYSRHGT